MPDNYRIEKSGRSRRTASVTEEDMAKINGLALEPLTAEQVYTFKINACDDQVDRDYEAFSLTALNELSELYRGKTVLLDHDWKSGKQTARIFDTAVIEEIMADGTAVHRLQLKAYMLVNESTGPIIEAIKGGIMREASVGVSVSEVRCSICGRSYFDSECCHIKGKKYEGRSCHAVLEHADDAYEVSFVAVPAQREAGTVKNLPEKPANAENTADEALDFDIEVEAQRYI